MTIYPESLKPILDKIDPTFGRSIDCDSGWWNLIEELHQEMKALDPDYRIYQIKEKFGGLRFYFASSNPLVAQQMQDIANYYERRSYAICEVTGKPGALMSKEGQFKTLHESFMANGWEIVESF